MNNSELTANARSSVIIVRNPEDPVASQPAAVWAAEKLATDFKEQALEVTTAETLESAARAEIAVLLAGAASPLAEPLLKEAGVIIPDAAESFGIARHTANGRTLLVVAGSDVRGLVYATLELADAVRYSDNATADLHAWSNIAEKPANEIRSVCRLFVSEQDDKPWFYDKTFWDDYLTELATHRFNRFCLNLGMGDDLGHSPGITDNYLVFSYPFLVSVEGYDVKVKQLSEAEKQLNLEMLRYISEGAKRRGLHFQLGLWAHAYELRESPNMNYTIEGLNADLHAPYCRDALRTLLEACPAIDGITFRIHYESGIPEPSHQFWQAVMSGLPQVGRPLEIDLHAKGLDDELVQIVNELGLKFTVSAKYWAEHMGLPYHQAAIRELEMPDLTSPKEGDRVITLLARKYTRYGYADYLNTERKFGLLHRIWPGSQRVLLWGDPALAAGYGRYGSIGGSLGIELCEPLTFKSRKGSGNQGGRDPYADASLRTGTGQWQKYLYTYRLWGRMLYNPDADPITWRRYLRKEYGQAAQAVEKALSHASRILPFITVAHLPSAANNRYWPEMYTNMSLLKGMENVYVDTEPPYTFGSVSPLDPALFYRIDDYAEDIVNGRLSGKYSPVEVADKLDELADTAQQQLEQAASLTENRRSASFRRLEIDVNVQIGIGRFFARKFRAALAFALYEKAGDPELLKKAVDEYHWAASAWKGIIEVTKGVYYEDITFGYVPRMRGHWSDRLADIEADIALLEQEYSKAEKNIAASGKEAAVARAFSAREKSVRPACLHKAPERIGRGEPVTLQIQLQGNASDVNVRLHYRHAHQAESYSVVEMTGSNGCLEATIPGEYTDTTYPIVYFFELRAGSEDAWISPGFAENLANQPYYMFMVQA